MREKGRQKRTLKVHARLRMLGRQTLQLGPGVAVVLGGGGVGC